MAFPTELELHQSVLDLARKAYECLKKADPQKAKDQKSDYETMEGIFNSFIKAAKEFKAAQQKREQKEAKKNSAHKEKSQKQEVKESRFLGGLFTVIDVKDTAAPKANAASSKGLGKRS